MATLLEVLIQASEKAASIARSCCLEENEHLLVAEKCERDANARFDKDFKTIADVLAQESAKTEIATRYPELAQHVRGEECSEIGGVSIKLEENVVKTAEILSGLVPLKVAERMAAAAHNDVDILLHDLPKELPPIDIADLGVWIDPIDATAEFIAGVRGEADADHGLPCVTVLIGAFRRSTGEPVIGVINQPFFRGNKGRILWGISYEDYKAWGCSDKDIHTNTNTVLMSGAENQDIIEKVKKSGWEVMSLPGAGNKLMKVALGEAAMYIVSKGTTFRWDTCAPHAILRAKGGDLITYTNKSPITYNVPESDNMQTYCNSGGIIAYTNPEFFEKFLK
ncbi:inositol polyphosphate 1-phosphatase [Plodia interpunctella]|uniref:inositol polyphosphate 1-phosphatase n=1 Tax=Plodia interpunctella TaxID=58824 RepID=UPI002368A1BA|nr:inositol polyphosphate 1-phosphatase [Plodia interpunctella]